jgi:hypothetical protein
MSIRFKLRKRSTGSALSRASATIVAAPVRRIARHLSILRSRSASSFAALRFRADPAPSAAPIIAFEISR